MPNLYISVTDYKKATTGQETSSLVSNLLRVGSNMSQGATSLPTNAVTTVSLSPYDIIMIFDGANSEEVTVTTETVAGASAIPISATLYAHSAGVVFCSDGTNGSLVEAIKIGCSNVESICRQPLFQATYTETLQLRSMGAAINSDGALNIRPRHFPVTAITALSLGMDQTTMLSYDPTQAFIPGSQRRITVPTLTALAGSGGNPLLAILPPFNQTTPGYATFTYTAGFTAASMDWDIKQAAILLTSNALSDRKNPTGSADLQIGKRKATVYLRGDTTGESALYKRACTLLQPYRRQP